MSGHRTDFHDQVSAPQARVLFQIERIFRSNLAPLGAHQVFVRRCAHSGLNVNQVTSWTRLQCITALQLLEYTAVEFKMHLFRDVSTGYEDFVTGKF